VVPIVGIELTTFRLQGGFFSDKPLHKIAGQQVRDSTPTPPTEDTHTMSNYNPDWAIAFQESSIECARKFFAKITSDQVKCDVVDRYAKLWELVA
jgi:hypothetical protein